MKKILGLSHLKRFAVNLGIFAFISVIITFLSVLLPKYYYNYKMWLYRERKWEHGGKLYESKFKVKKWKVCLPELADFIKFIFPKKFIKEFSTDYMSKYLMESCRAELTHWCIIFSTVVFLIFENTETFIYMFFIAFIANIPFIIIQRYNRPRILNIMKHKGMR